MSYLAYITDQILLKEVRAVLDKAEEAKTEKLKTFRKNVIDPFGPLFQVAAFDYDYAGWHATETRRQLEKTLQNHVGTFHQNILGAAKGWQNLGAGQVLDVRCDAQKIVADIKNKHNTTKGDHLSSLYKSLHEQVMPKHSLYKGYTAYVVHIIPKKPVRYDKEFTPSDKNIGAQKKANSLIRQIDGASFYQMVTGRKDALIELYEALPKVIQRIVRAKTGNKKFMFPDKARFKENLDAAYIK